MKNSPNSIDTPGELLDLFVISISVAMVFMFLGGLGLAYNPDVVEGIYYSTQGERPQTSGETVTFSQEMFTGENGLNSVYLESDEEFGFCLQVRDGEVTEMMFPKEIDKVTEKSLAIKCQGKDKVNGLVHTHPGYLAIPELSETDKETLQNSSLQVSCVMSGTTYPGDENIYQTFNCFNEDLERLRVVIQ